MKKVLTTILGLGIIVSIGSNSPSMNYKPISKRKKVCVKINSPYKTIFNHLKLEHLTDTVLIQNRTKVFGCGTAYRDYENELEKSGLYKFYDEYGNILSDRKLFSVFERKHNVKILWIERGNEGELFQLEDTLLHKNTNLENRLIREKTYIEFDENPTSMNDVTINILIYTDNKTEWKIRKSFELTKKMGKWRVDKEN